MQWNELVVLSHLRWDFVWQRPQHLISRLAVDQPTWFVEEPMVADVEEPVLRWRRHGLVTQVWLEVPGPHRHVDFVNPEADCYAEMLASLIGPSERRAVWLYTPMALELAEALEPSFVIYDVMDDLASFKNAPAALRAGQDQLLDVADVVFAGGRSLHQGVIGRRPDAHLFPSGVETEHFAPARSRRVPRGRPVAGYVGVIDERLDLDLLAGVAAELHDWDIDVVGPVAKIDAGSLPVAPNLSYPGSRQYAELPDVMAGFDVAIMPFALNDATRSISPTKTLEYLAAGLPVVSTPVPDVVSDFFDVVALAESSKGFARACQKAILEECAERDRAAWPVLQRQHWDAVATRMASILRRSTTVVAIADLAGAEDSA
jgi:glycosyltransferase involved in cell wall biosynthesis